MAIRTCGDILHSMGQITAEQKNFFNDQFERLKNEFIDSGEFADEAAAARKANEVAGERMRQNILRTQYADAMTLKTRTQNLEALRQSKDVERTASDILKEMDDGAQSILAQAISRNNAEELIDSLRSTIPGELDRLLQKNKTTARNVARVLHGDKTITDAGAIKVAKQFQDVVDDLHRQLGKGGRFIDKVQNWGLPHTWPRMAVVRLGQTNFQDLLFPRLDRQRMRHSNGTRMTDDEIRQLIDDVYEDINTGGKAKLSEENRVLPTLGGDPLTRHRVFHFKDADSWEEVHKAMGGDDIEVFGIMGNHIENLALEASAARTFGPKTRSNFERLVNDAVAEGAKKGQTVSAARLRREFNTAFRNPNPDTDPNIGIGITTDVINASRKMLNSIRLGFASMNAAVDLGYASSLMADIGSSSGRFLADHVRNISKIARGDTAALRREHLKLGAALDNTNFGGGASTRFDISETTGNLSRAAAKFEDWTIRASGLNAWTNSAKWAATKHLNFSTADFLKGRKSDTKFFEWFKTTYRLSDQDMSNARAAIAKRDDGLEYIDFGKINPETGIKLRAAFQDVTRLAVPEPDLRTRALLTQGTSAGTLGGQAIRVMTQLKSFPAYITLQTINRLTDPNLSARSKGVFLASRAAKVFVLGTIVTQAIQMAKGRDPYAWDDPQLYLEGFLRGGGLGIISDLSFVLEGDKRGVADFVLGPTGSFYIGMISTLGRMVSAEIDDDPETSARSVAAKQAFGGSRPGNLFYADLVFSRLVQDPVWRLANPNAEREWEKAARRMERKSGNRNYWKRGELTPERAPNLFRTKDDERGIR